MSLLKENVLILNKYYLAVQVVIAREAIISLVTGKAHVIDENYKSYTLKQWHQYTREASKIICSKYSSIIRSPSIQILIPQVIRFSNCQYNNPVFKNVKYSRKNILKRDKFICQYCKKKVDKNNITIDHIIPKSKGGTSNWNNIVTCCKVCNTKKGDLSIEDLKWELLKKPISPKWNSSINLPLLKIKKRYWKKFLE